jgi:Cu+-exporting ATPase
VEQLQRKLEANGEPRLIYAPRGAGYVLRCHELYHIENDGVEEPGGLMQVIRCEGSQAPALAPTSPRPLGTPTTPATMRGVGHERGMEIEREHAAAKTEYRGQTFYFCSPGCKTALDKEPTRYATEGVPGQTDASRAVRWRTDVDGRAAHPRAVATADAPA